jgi:Fe-S-cluster-containing hydrogenase component 2
MSKKFLIADPAKCTGCAVCELICSASKDKVFNKRMSRIRTVKLEPFVQTAVACRLCEDPRCVRVCPRRALTQNKETGVITVDTSKCSGCGWLCIQACEFGAITIHPDKRTAIVCDLCEGDPPCVKFCITEALKLVTLDTLTEKARRSVIGELFPEKQSKSLLPKG